MHSERIAKRLDELGMNQSDLARKSGLSAAYINGLVHGKRGKRIGASAAQKLAKGLRVGVSFFFDAKYTYENKGA
jgi:transcriptional regulator with XRE-family HTH domain